MYCLEVLVLFWSIHIVCYIYVYSVTIQRKILFSFPLQSSHSFCYKLPYRLSSKYIQTIYDGVLLLVNQLSVHKVVKISAIFHTVSLW